VAGMMILSLGLLGLSTVGPNSSVIVVAAWLGVTGLGTGIFISPNSSALMGSAPKRMQGTAGGVMGVARNLGMMTGVALATVVFKAAGGTTGIAWRPDEFGAFSVSFYAAAGISILAALVSALRPKST